MSSMALVMAQWLLVEHGIFPGDFLRRPPGEQAVICAMLIDHNRRREEAQ